MMLLGPAQDALHGGDVPRISQDVPKSTSPRRDAD